MLNPKSNHELAQIAFDRNLYMVALVLLLLDDKNEEPIDVSSTQNDVFHYSAF